MNSDPISILVIDDNLDQSDPLIVSLQERFGESHTRLERRSSKALDFILNNDSSKLIVLLDLDLGTTEPNGFEVFNQIRSKTDLIYVIILTASHLQSIAPAWLIEFIKKDAFSILQKTTDTRTIMAEVEKAAQKLEGRIDCVIEEWILKQVPEKRDQPYMIDSFGKSYTLNDLLHELRSESDVGNKLQSNITQLALDFFKPKSGL